MNELRKYSIPYSGRTKEVEFWWDEQEHTNIERVTQCVRKMSLREVEDMLVDIIYGQLKGRIELKTVEEMKKK